MKMRNWYYLFNLGEASDKERHFFSAELEVMKMLPAHANVIRLVGSYTANGKNNRIRIKLYPPRIKKKNN